MPKPVPPQLVDCSLIEDSWQRAIVCPRENRERMEAYQQRLQAFEQSQIDSKQADIDASGADEDVRQENERRSLIGKFFGGLRERAGFNPYGGQPSPQAPQE